jgi:hypothetical protein
VLNALGVERGRDETVEADYVADPTGASLSGGLDRSAAAELARN